MKSVPGTDDLAVYVLTEFQATVVADLLDVLADEAELSGELTPWGELRGRRLIVWCPVDAVDDLCRRADWMIDEAPGHGRNGGPGARSLRKLARLIADGVAAHPFG